MAGYYEIHKSASGVFTFNLKAGNHQIILTSRAYESIHAACDAIDLVRRHSQQVPRFQCKVARDDSVFFVLTDDRGQVLGRSQMYSSDSAVDHGIRSVMENGSSTSVKGLAVEPARNDARGVR